MAFCFLGVVAGDLDEITGSGTTDPTPLGNKMDPSR